MSGAFTGALADRLGRFQLADGGSLFLDEIGELQPELQVKLLRVLQDGEFEKVGSTQTIRVDVRLIAATNRDLTKAIDNGTFRPVFLPTGKPDLHFTARLSAFLQMVSRQEDPDTLFFNRSLTIEGDTELGLRVKNMLDALEWPRLSWQGLRPTFLKT